MASRADFHWPCRDIHVGQLAELVIHAWQLALYIFRGFMRDVEECAAVFGSSSFADFGIDGTSDHVAGRKLHALGIVLLHEPLAVLVGQDSALAAHRLGN